MKNKRILLVDDEAELVEMLTRKAEREGYEVFSASNGKEAMLLLEKQKVDLILTDVVMPLMDGFTFFKAIRSDQKLSNIPVIVLSARAGMEDAFQVLGVEEFIVKPFSGEDVVLKIREVLKLDSKENMNKGDIIICGNDRDIEKQIVSLISQRGFDVERAFDSPEFIARSIRVAPRFVLIDIIMEDFPTKSTIRAIRCFAHLKKVPIILYSNFLPEQMGDIESVEQLKEAKDACLEAGATKYIGRYSSVNFMDSIKGYF